VFCQLDTLRRCIPADIWRVLNELPTTLDETYERTLQGIPVEKWQHAHRLFHCLLAAVRPLHAEELAEIFAIQFDQTTAPKLEEGWRPEDPEEAVLSACSSLIAVVEAHGSRIVQFSHFSVKEFLTSDRLANSKVGNVSRYYIHIGPAHMILAQACLTVLLQFDTQVNKKHVQTLPLAFYAAQHWIDHATFGDMTSQVEGAIQRLFDPNEPYLGAWTWIYNMDRGLERSIHTLIECVIPPETIERSTHSVAEHPTSPEDFERSIHDLTEHPTPPMATSLYYAVLCGLSWLAKHLVITHTEDVNARCGYHGSPLHAASYKGYTDCVRILLEHGADVNMKNKLEKSPLQTAYDGGHFETIRVLLEHGADVDVQDADLWALSHHASFSGQLEIVYLLLQHHADVNSKNNSDWTPLHQASFMGNIRVVQLLLENGADVNARSKACNTPLFIASTSGNVEITRLLLEHGADVLVQGPGNRTPLQAACIEGHHEITRLLMEHGAKM
jgi:ankyrin repeat protein